MQTMGTVMGVRITTVTCLLLYAFVATRAKTAPQACSPNYGGYFSRENKCFKISALSETGAEAKQICTNEDASLPIIHNEAKRAFIRRFAEDNKMRYNNNLDTTLPMGSAAHVDDGSQNGWDSEEEAVDEWPEGVICEKRASLTPQCPSEYVMNAERNTCVKIHRDQKLSWKDAREECGNIGGDLVVVSDSATINFIKDILVDDSLQCWIGLSNSISNEGIFTWVHGDAPLEFDNWNSGFPVSLEPKFSTSCTAMVQDGLRWENRDCVQAKQFVCEKEAFQPLFCPGEGWIMDPTDKKCYKMISTKQRWKASRDVCLEDGGDLVSITDNVTWEFLKGLMSTDPNIATRLWIGLSRDPDQNNKFIWLDGSGAPVYTWPENLKNEKEQCGTFQYHDNKHILSDLDCTKELPSICKKEASMDYPVQICPHGFTSHFTHGGDWRIYCLKAYHGAKVTYKGAKQACADKEGYLFDVGSSQQLDEEDVQEFVKKSLLDPGLQYWVLSDEGDNSSSCLLYKASGGLEPSESCDRQMPYICRATGLIKYTIRITGLTTVSKEVALQVNESSMGVYPLGGVCQFDTFGDFLVSRDDGTVMINVTTAAAYVELNPRYAIERVNHAECFITTGLPNTTTECCSEVLVWFYKGSYVMFPMEKLHCLCSNDIVQTHIATTETNPTNSHNVTTQTNPTKSHNVTTQTNPTNSHNVSTETNPTKSHNVTTQTNPTNSHNVTTETNPTNSHNVTTEANVTYIQAVTTHINSRMLQTVSNDIHFQSDEAPNQHQRLSDVCQFETVEAYSRSYGWAINTSAVVFVEVNSTYWITETANETQCFNRSAPRAALECCSEVTTLYDQTFHESADVTLTMLPLQKLLCLCPNAIVKPQDPTPMSQENVETLKNLTSQQQQQQHSNGSIITQNKLCPCPCDRVAFDPNPSPEKLSKMLWKIKKELSVNKNTLSTKRNKKISAGDSRAESQTIGYVSLVLCFIPLGFIVGIDLMRVFQFFKKKRGGND